MNVFAHPLTSLCLLATCMLIGASACSALKSEFCSSPATNAVTGVVTPATATVPPVVPQLNEAAAVAGTVLPAPWGSLVSNMCLMLAAGASAFATFHARAAAASSAAAATACVPAAPVSASPGKN